jgi:predicted ribonuclease YlaK
MRVIAEIDDKKAAPNNPKLRRRARTRINMLEGLLLGDGPLRSIREGVTVTVVDSTELDPETRRLRPPPPDVEILDTCAALAAYAPGAVSLVTGDLAMKMRAREAGIVITAMPAECYQPLGDADSEPPQ